MSDRRSVPVSAAGGTALAGGRTSGAIQIADTVRKPWTKSTPAVHAVLNHLASMGFEGAPRALGVDDHDRQVLSLLPGDIVGDQMPWPAWVWSEAVLADVGRWLRRLHDCTAEFVPGPDAVWFSGRSWRPNLIIGHHDAAPWNAVAREGRLVGFIDWDTAGPCSRGRDLAFTALAWTPLVGSAFAARLGFTTPYRRSRRLHLLLDAYGYEGERPDFAEQIIERARIQAEAIRRLADGGDPVYIAMLPLAAEMDVAAASVGALPRSFWTSS